MTDGRAGADRADSGGGGTGGWTPASLALALGLGTAGGILFFLLHVPLAFLIGAMVVTTAAAMAGLPVAVPGLLRGAMVAVLGIMLGSAFTPAMIDQVPDWAVSLTGLLVYVIVAAAVGLAYLRRVARYDRVTGYFAAMPGGFNEMVMMGAAMGGDDRTIALNHSLRILMTVMLVPIAFSLLPGFQAQAREWSIAGLGPALDALPVLDWVILAACGLIGVPVAKWLKVPAGILVGPMVLSAAVHLAGITAGKPPGLVVAAAQIVVGAAVGARFAGVPLRQVARTALVALGLTVLLLLVTVVMALAVHVATGLDLAALILAYAPGGLAEMSLVALSLNADPAFVATHHILRIGIVVMLAPLAFRIWARLRP
ncbi:MAG: hypothetical protein RLY86_2835 [Pseudomonadota bacterium]|jgi:membrane AbrB-like protein